MYCKKCGKEISDNSIYCNHCGTRQTPKKIVVEFNKPSIPSISEDSIRSGIFSFGRCLKKWIVSLKPVLVSFLITGIITGAAYGITYYSIFYYNLPPEASVSEINFYRYTGITSSEEYFKINGRSFPVTRYDYENPSHILPKSKWKWDCEMMENGDSWFDGETTNINRSRKKYLNYKSVNVASGISLISFALCLLYYFVIFIIWLRKWLYRK